MNVFFDVLDTLLTEEDVPRPHAREVLCRLKGIGRGVYLWSSAGGAYAAEAAEVLGIADLVDDCFGKRQEPEVGVDFAVDDDASVVESYGGYRVKPFGGDPRDEELLRALWRPWRRRGVLTRPANGLRRSPAIGGAPVARLTPRGDHITAVGLPLFAQLLPR